MEELITQRGVLLDRLALAAGLALGIVVILFWCVEVLAAQSLPVWFYAIGLAAMTAASYAQLQQRHGEDEA
jgi:uncharacterized membrane protein YhhN